MRMEFRDLLHLGATPYILINLYQLLISNSS
jgi:hypothetical protein